MKEKEQIIQIGERKRGKKRRNKREESKIEKIK
jgi:hypothetical protein